MSSVIFSVMIVVHTTYGRGKGEEQKSKSKNELGCIACFVSVRRATRGEEGRKRKCWSAL
jgi:hypothetical protein